MPAEQIDGARQSPFWPAMEAIAPTLAYDHAGAMGADGSVPTGLAARVTGPALVMYGDASFPFMAGAARALSQAMPDARLRVVEGETHDVNPAVLAPVLTEFFTAG
jgi:pimeloyl-ACP methyl ester carboxylesterase